MNLGEKIKCAREAIGLTQEDLGKRCGTTKQTIYKYETGKVTNIPIDRLQNMADILGVSAAYLLGWNEQEQPAEIGKLSGSEESIIRLFRMLPEDLRASFHFQLVEKLKDQGLL